MKLSKWCFGSAFLLNGYYTLVRYCSNFFDNLVLWGFFILLEGVNDYLEHRSVELMVWRVYKMGVWRGILLILPTKMLIFSIFFQSLI